MKTVRAILFYFWQFTYAILQNIAGLVMLAIYKSRGAKSEIFHNAVITLSLIHISEPTRP